jgi:hypothetical protein
MNMMEIPQGVGSGFVWDDNGNDITVVTNYRALYGLCVVITVCCIGRALYGPCAATAMCCSIAAYDVAATM